MNNERLKTAKQLAKSHYDFDPDIVGIYLLELEGTEEDQSNEPVKLLEVTENTIPAGVMPIYFRARPERGIKFSSAIVQVTPAEFERINNRSLPLPPHWRFHEKAPIPREEAK